MLALMCKAAGNRFAVDARQVLEVVPRVRLESVAGTPAWLAGMCVYRGRIVPVLDLAQLAAGAPSPNQWSSRILLVHINDEATSLLFGLIVDQVAVTQLALDRPEAAVGPGVAPWGSMLLDDDGMFQMLEVSRILTADRRTALLSHALESKDG